MTQSIVLKYKDFVGNTLEVKCICTVTAMTLLFDFMLKTIWHEFIYYAKA